MATIQPSIPKNIPLQYYLRACEAKKILSVTDLPPEVVAKRIALAELGQIVLFIAQAILYTAAYLGAISPFNAGLVSITLIPLQAICSYQTFVHQKPVSRTLLTIAAVITLAACALLALNGIIQDSSITLCAGGALLHTFRNFSEYLDAQNSKKNPEYLERILKQT